MDKHRLDDGLVRVFVEREKIGAAIDAIDSAIALHERKIMAYKELKLTLKANEKNGN